MATGWIITFALIIAYFIFVTWLIRSGRLEKWNLSLLLGFILMTRTQRGRATLDAVAKPKRAWNAFGDFGIVFTLLGMVLMTIVMLALIPTVLDPASGVEPLAANEILVIPGVNPFVPLWYGIAALIITLVVHEGGHGVLARANNLKVKSLGLLYAIVPIGAFVEPDEEEMEAASRRARLRVFAAGATVNMVLAAALLVALAAMAGSMEAIPGVGVQTVTLDGPAEAAGILPKDIIVSADGTDLATWDAFVSYLDTRSPGDTVDFGLHSGSTAAVELTSRWSMLEADARADVLAFTESAQAFCAGMYDPNPQTGAACADRLQADAFLGIQGFPAAGYQGALANPVAPAGNLLFYLTLPLFEVRGSPVLSALPDFFEAPGGDAFFIGFNLIFWTFWINLMVGLTNILPMLPLDGGHIFRDAAAGVLAKMRPKMAAERQAQVVGRAATTISLVILGAFLLQIFGPRLSGLFGA